jgi:hypothetical protein
LTLGVVQADMEGIEKIWSSSGLMGASMSEMGPGSRQDMLDDFWHYWNWNKVVSMGEHFFSLSSQDVVCSRIWQASHFAQTTLEGENRKMPAWQQH